jgi:hypothetical protein
MLLFIILVTIICFVLVALWAIWSTREKIKVISDCISSLELSYHDLLDETQFEASSNTVATQLTDEFMLQLQPEIKELWQALNTRTYAAAELESTTIVFEELEKLSLQFLNENRAQTPENSSHKDYLAAVRAGVELDLSQRLLQSP